MPIRSSVIIEIVAKNFIYIFAVIAFTFIIACKKSNGFLDNTTKTNLTNVNGTIIHDNKIIAPDSGCYAGVSIWTVENNIALLDNYIALAGKSPNFVMFFSHWEDNYDRNFNTQGCDSIYSRGCIPYITWCPSSDGSGATQPKYKLTNITQGLFDDYIIQFAKDIKSWNKPVFLRFGMEMNADWLPWCGNVNGNNNGSDFINAWQHIHYIFDSLSVVNVTWLWCPYVESMYNWGDMKQYYPGNEYVDWVGCDGYGYTPDHWATAPFEKVFQSTLIKLINTGKPIIIGELACGEYKADTRWKRDWMEDAFTKIQNDYPIKAFNWFNYNKEQDWRIESSAASLYTYKSKVSKNRYFKNAGICIQ